MYRTSRQVRMPMPMTTSPAMATPTTPPGPDTVMFGSTGCDGVRRTASRGTTAGWPGRLPPGPAPRFATVGAATGRRPGSSGRPRGPGTAPASGAGRGWSCASGEPTARRSATRKPPARTPNNVFDAVCQPRRMSVKLASTSSAIAAVHTARRRSPARAARTETTPRATTDAAARTYITTSTASRNPTAISAPITSSRDPHRREQRRRHRPQPRPPRPRRRRELSPQPPRA